MPLMHKPVPSSSASDAPPVKPSVTLKDRVRGITTPPQPEPQPRPTRPLRQVEPEHLELARLAESCARRYFDELAATPHGPMKFDRERFAEAIQQAVQEAVHRAYRDHPAVRARSPFTRNRAAS